MPASVGHEPTRIVGTLVITGQSGFKAFLYEGGRMFDLQKMLVNARGWVLLNATTINDRGQIAVVAHRPPEEYSTVLLDPVCTGN